MPQLVIYTHFCYKAWDATIRENLKMWESLGIRQWAGAGRTLRR